MHGTRGKFLNRRLFAGLGLAILAATLAFSIVNASGTKWVTKRVGWDGAAAYGAGVNITSGGKDTVNLLGASNPVDSARTVQINTADWAWEEAVRQPNNQTATNGGNAAVDSLQNVAMLTLTCVARTTGNRTDTVYAAIEQCQEGGCGHTDIVHGGLTVARSVPLVADPGSLWGAGLAAATVPYALQTGAQVVFRGWIKVDPNSQNVASNAFLMSNFRLNLAPGGTSNAATLYRCRLYITYPQRAQP